MQISNLESELGVTLLDRGSRPILPTEAGRVVAAQAYKNIGTCDRQVPMLLEIIRILQPKLFLLSIE